MHTTLHQSVISRQLLMCAIAPSNPKNGLLPLHYADSEADASDKQHSCCCVAMVACMQLTMSLQTANNCQQLSLALFKKFPYDNGSPTPCHQFRHSTSAADCSTEAAAECLYCCCWLLSTCSPSHTGSWLPRWCPRWMGRTCPAVRRCWPWRASAAPPGPSARSQAYPARSSAQSSAARVRS